MNKLQLFFLLRKNAKLNAKRNVMFEANQYGKLIGYIVLAIFAVVRTIQLNSCHKAMPLATTSSSVLIM